MKKFIRVLFLIFILSAICLQFGFIYKKDYIAIIGAMDMEIEEISKNLSSLNEIKNSKFKISKGKFAKSDIIIAKSGVGKVNSAITTQYIIDKFHPKYIINTGLAGSLDKKFKLGDVIIADKMVQYDFDTSVFGYAKGYMSTGIEPDKPTIYYSDSDIIKLVKNDIDKLNLQHKVYIGTIATGDTFIEKQSLKEEIKKEFKALAVDMESAAIAQTANKNNIPLIVIRTISDKDDDSAQTYEKNEYNLALQSSRNTLAILRKLSDKDFGK